MAIGIEWLDPVTNRNAAHIDYAKTYLNVKKTSYSSLEELTGCLNVSDLNRIEGNIGFLANALDTALQVKEWSSNMIPTVSDESRILKNADTVIITAKDYFGNHTIPDLPDSLSVYSDFNQLERALLSVYNVLFEPIYTEKGERFILEDGRYLVVRRSLENG